MPLPIAFQHLQKTTAYFSVHLFVANPCSLSICFSVMVVDHFQMLCRVTLVQELQHVPLKTKAMLLSRKLEEKHACCLSAYKISLSILKASSYALLVC